MPLNPTRKRMNQRDHHNTNNNTGRRRGRLSSPSHLFHVLIVLWCATLATLSFFQSSCGAKEIDVTAEWTLVGENDTIPAGVHVRMDLSTGEKWVKLIDDNDETNNDKTSSTSTTTTTTTAMAEVKHDGGSGLSVVATTTEDSRSSSDKTIPVTKKEPDYDYDMMHRTLSQLPDEEKERIGGLPELPGPAQRVDPMHRLQFEQRMREIWMQRQEELKQLNEVIADLPELLKDRIQRLQEYLANPYAQLQELNLDEAGKQILDDVEEGEDDRVTDIVSMLQDLEYHLSDMDMTRDFYTLGGWPLLVSLLSDSVHHSSNTNSTTTTSPTTTASSSTTTADLHAKVHLVQTYAAWAIGTAVKNTEEFHSYAIEQVVVNGRTETPLTLLLQLVVAEPKKDIDAVPNHSHVHRQTKSLYGLSSLLRGNRLAQIHFCAGDGPLQLGKLLLETGTAQQQQQPSSSSSSSRDVAKRLLTLAHDIVSDVALHAGRSPQVDQAIVKSFASEPWCQAVVLFLRQTSNSNHVIRETALQTYVSLAPHCQYDDKVAAESLAQLQQTWEKESKDDMDPDHWQERKQLLDAALKLQTSTVS